ncbi:Crp/Fnr family transcriptional regulator [Clostridium vitabionis]|uniref:Crp/Fnr family transcriptional regulator n=1 Tax=Clostridium vitabionis TaxID=2784388 RepID=UPI00188CD7D0|nr:Crp/Fnr family transcriptional regulator [Clostridium vitabionis]
MDRETLKVLRKSHVFDGISDKNIAALLACLGTSVRTYSAGNYLIMESDSVQYVGLVLEGRVSMQKEDALGNLTYMTDIRSGELLGESFSLGFSTRSLVHFVAVSDCRVLFLPLWKILHVCGNQCAFHSQLIVNMFSLLSEKNKRLMEKLHIISQPTIRGRLLAYFQNEAGKISSSPIADETAKSGYCLTLRYSRRELADYLSVNRSALSRELSRMQAEGILRIEGKQVTVLA